MQSKTNRFISLAMSAAILLTNMVTPMTANADEVTDTEAGVIETEAAPEYIVTLPYHEQLSYSVDGEKIYEPEGRAQENKNTYLQYEEGETVRLQIKTGETIRMDAVHLVDAGSKEYSFEADENLWISFLMPAADVSVNLELSTVQTEPETEAQTAAQTETATVVQTEVQVEETAPAEVQTEVMAQSETKAEETVQTEASMEMQTEAAGTEETAAQETAAQTEMTVQDETPSAPNVELTADIEDETEVVTEAATEAETKAGTEAVTEATAEAVTEATAEAAAESPMEAVTEKATETAMEDATEPATEIAIEEETEAVTEATTEEASEATTEGPLESVSEEVTEADTEEAGDGEYKVTVELGDEIGVALDSEDGTYDAGDTVTFTTDLGSGELVAAEALKSESTATEDTADLLYSEVSYDAASNTFSFVMPEENVALSVQKDALLGASLMSASNSSDDEWDDETAVEAGSYYYYSDGKTHPFDSVMGTGGNDSYKYVRYNVDGVTYTVYAYCLQHDLSSPPSGTTYYTMTELDEGGDDRNIRKALFYGYGGPGWGQTFNGFNIQNLMISAGCTTETRALQHYLVDYYYDGSIGYGGKLSQTAIKLLADIRYCIKNMPDPTTSELLPGLSTAPESTTTETFEWKAGEEWIITIALEDGVQLVNETTERPRPATS